MQLPSNENPIVVRSDHIAIVFFVNANYHGGPRLNPHLPLRQTGVFRHIEQMILLLLRYDCETVLLKVLSDLIPHAHVIHWGAFF